MSIEPKVEQLREVSAAAPAPDIPPMPRYMAIGFVRGPGDYRRWCSTEELCHSPQQAYKEIIFQGCGYKTEPSTVRVFEIYEVPEANAKG